MKMIGRSIRDDEVAVKMCARMRPWRKSQGLLQREVAALIGGMRSYGAIAKVEAAEGGVSPGMYNKIAEFMGWPKYQSGRKWADWVKVHAHDNEGERQGRFDFDDVSPSPAEGLFIWLKANKELKSHVDILADVYITTPESIITSAIKAYISQRKEMIHEHAEREAYLAEQRKKIPQ